MPLFRTPEDDDVGPSPDQTLMDQLDKIEGVYFEVSVTLGNTDYPISKTEDAEILDEIKNSDAVNNKGTTLNWPSFSETPFQNIATKECSVCCFRGFTQVGIGTPLIFP
jgi:hypothetical protein